MLPLSNLRGDEHNAHTKAVCPLTGVDGWFAENQFLIPGPAHSMGAEGASFADPMMADEVMRRCSAVAITKD